MPELEPEHSKHSDWPLRPWLLAAMLGLAGLLIHLVTHEHDDVPWQMAVAAFLFFGPVAASLTIEENDWKAPAIFSLVIGLVMAGLAWRAVRYGDYLPDEQYGFAAGVVASALAIPLFQAGFLKTRLKTPYSDIHYHGWNDSISAAGALAFMGLSWVALSILSKLFQLLKIDVLQDLMEHGWFGWTFSGLAFGAALGTLRNQSKVLGTLQSVVMLVMSLLAVPLAFGLTVFLIATAVSGPQVLWEATRSATPVLLACAAGAFLLANAIVRNGDAEMTRSKVLRIAAIVLSAVILPLAVFAAVSMGLRLAQHGLSPERLWALVAIVVACVCGVGCWAALASGRKGTWPERLRDANFHLALGVCGLAILLALPILDFAAISTRSQVARLESGKVSTDDFDFAALRWDFGEPGRKALRKLTTGGNERIAELAGIALAQTERTYWGTEESVRTAEDFKVRVQPESPELRKLVLDHLTFQPWLCPDQCVAVDLGAAEGGGRIVAIVSASTGYQAFVLKDGVPGVEATDAATVYGPITANSKVEIREITRRYIVVDGKPLDPPIDALEGLAAPR